VRRARYNLVIAADEPEIEEAAEDLRRCGVNVETVQADLATVEGVAMVVEAIGDRTSMRCSRMPVTASVMRSSTRISTRYATSSTPTSPARSTSSTRSSAGCAHADADACS
jgi:UDP-N-acetylglucosamine enolpyruvyl transferase